MKAIALTSKNGIPIASMVEKKGEHESFSTLSATILGASDVIFSSMENDEPENIIIDSQDAVLMIKEVADDSVLSLLGDVEDKDSLKDKIDEIKNKIEEIREEPEVK